MARRKKATRRRRKFTGVNVTQAVIGYAGASIWSQALLKVNPIEFIMSPKGTRSNEITLRELIDSFAGGTGGVFKNTADAMGIEQNALAMIQANAKANWIDAAIQSVGLTAGSAIGMKLTKKPRAFLNKQVRAFGLGDLVRF